MHANTTWDMVVFYFRLFRESFRDQAIYKTNRGERDKICMDYMEKRAKVLCPTPLSIGLNG